MLLKNNILKILHKFTKYFVGAGLFFLFYMFLLRGFTDIAGINYLLSAICAFTITAIGGFIFQKNVTFKNKNRHNIKQMSLFTMFLLIGLCFDLSFLKIGVGYLGFHYLYVAIVSKGITFLRNFIMNYFFTFK